MSKLEGLHRYVLIVDLIRRNRYISLDDLIIELQKSLKDTDNVATSKRTVQRDMKEINANIITIRYSKIEKGYFIPSDEVSELERMLKVFDMLNCRKLENQLKN